MGVADDIPEANFEFRINANTITGSSNKSIEMREYQYILYIDIHIPGYSYCEYFNIYQNLISTGTDDVVIWVSVSVFY